MANRKTKLVCLCNGVSEKEILKLLMRGTIDIDEVKKNTLASTGCGKCRREVESIVNQYFTINSKDAQQKINF